MVGFGEEPKTVNGPKKAIIVVCVIIEPLTEVGELRKVKAWEVVCGAGLGEVGEGLIIADKITHFIVSVVEENVLVGGGGYIQDSEVESASI